MTSAGCDMTTLNTEDVYKRQVSEALYDFLLEAYDQNSERLSAAAEAAMYHLDSVAQMERVRLGSVF